MAVKVEASGGRVWLWAVWLCQLCHGAGLGRCGVEERAPRGVAGRPGAGILPQPRGGVGGRGVGILPQLGARPGRGTCIGKRNVVTIEAMPQPKQHSSNAQRQAAYRERLKLKPKPEPQPQAKPIPAKPGKARWRALHAQAQAALEALRDELQEVYDDRSENWQESDAGEEWNERLGVLDTAIEAVEAVEL